jgi:predicted alpha/beta hydrolase family esterase
MKNVVILHGTGETDNSFWFPWIKNKLQQKGYTVSIPLFPHADYPDLTTWLPVALKGTYTPETILLGHSAGGPLLLSVLEQIDVKIKQAILVAGYARPKGKKKEAEKILQQNYNWGKIRNTVEEIIFINSDNDPWGCNEVEGKYMVESLGTGTLIIPKGEAHMGSNTFNQPYKEFPLLLKLIE